jgi:hypothetical protein
LIWRVDLAVDLAVEWAMGLNRRPRGQPNLDRGGEYYVRRVTIRAHHASRHNYYLSGGMRVSASGRIKSEGKNVERSTGKMNQLPLEA